MMRLFKGAARAKAEAEEAIRQSEDTAADYHNSLEENSEAHEKLMQQIDRRRDDR